MKKPLILLFFLLQTYSVHALEVEYKLLFLDVPEGDLKNVAVANFPDANLIISGSDWWMSFSDIGFDRDCKVLKQHVEADCSIKNRLALLDNNEAFKRLLLGGYIYPLGLQKHEYKQYLMYSAISENGLSMAILVERETGNTIDIKGNFGHEHLKMLRLK